MPVDRLNANNPSRPLMPTLASTRTAKTPVAPRLAAPQTSSSVAKGRRSDRIDADNPLSSTARGQLATPATKLNLGNNITPRSSSRKSRAGSTQSTPNDTPTSTPTSTTRPVSGLDFGRRDGLTVQGPPLANGSGRPQSIAFGQSYSNTQRSRSPNSAVSRRSGLDARSKEESSRFFHASDVASQAPNNPPSKKASSFFYADGRRETTNVLPEPIPSPPLSSLGKASSVQSQFFHASQKPLESGLQPSAPSPPSLEAIPEPGLPSQIAAAKAAFRSPSPEKVNIHLSYRKGVSQIMRPYVHRAPPSSSSLLSENESVPRRPSIDSPALRITHAKSASLSSIDSMASPPPRTSDLQPASPSIPVASRLPSSRTPPSRIDTRQSTSSDGTSLSPSALTAEPTTPQQLPQSPTASVHAGAKLQKLNELAANARRERKVLDLEISNNSLLAINRSLEREVRKQKAELRRFRRLSRAGRFSTGTTRTSVGEVSTVEDDETSELLADVDEEDEAEAETFSSESSSEEDSSLSPDAQAEKDARHIAKDERRLQLDLSKHKELLIDSQKLNQSIKRCLGWTEELIAEGKKALNYQVRVSDIKLGGRILSTEDRGHDGAHDEDDDHAEDNDDLTSPRFGAGGSLLGPASPNLESEEKRIEALLSSVLGGERTDRDSGIDLDGQGIDQALEHIS